MDYEKLHKDTINKLQQMVSCGKITVETARGICADFVPESEDEKIRKHLITLFINDYGKNSNARFAGIKVKDIIAWLENKEQKSAEWSEEDEKLFKLSLENLTELKDRFGEEYGKVGDCIVWLKSLKDRCAFKPSKELPHWKKITIPNNDVTGFNSENFTYKGYYINYVELFEKLPKDD